MNPIARGNPLSEDVKWERKIGPMRGGLWRIRSYKRRSMSATAELFVLVECNSVVSCIACNTLTLSPYFGLLDGALVSATMR